MAPDYHNFHHWTAHLEKQWEKASTYAFFSMGQFCRHSDIKGGADLKMLIHSLSSHSSLQVGIGLQNEKNKTHNASTDETFHEALLI